MAFPGLSPEFLLLVHGLAVISACVLVVLGAAWDACTFEIPDWVSIGIAGVFVVALATRGFPTGMAIGHLITGGGVFAIGALLFAARVFGGGDVKMLSAVALWAGPAGIATLTLAVAITGGVLCLALLGGRALAARTASVPQALRPLLVGEARVPYGIAIAVGALVLFLTVAPRGAGLF